jgi:hypothetical protein
MRNQELEFEMPGLAEYHSDEALRIAISRDLASLVYHADADVAECVDLDRIEDIFERNAFKEALSGTTCEPIKKASAKATADYKTMGGQIAYHNARALLKGREATLTLTQWRNILTAFDNSCAYCEHKLTSKFPMMEHVVPIMRGGGTTAGNVVPTCGYCNTNKFIKLIEVWKKGDVVFWERFNRCRAEAIRLNGERPQD